MKNRYVYIILLITVFFISCKQKQTKSIILEIALSAKYNDTIQIFYTNNSTIQWDENKSFKKKLIGSNKVQKIKVNFITPPSSIRIDLGQNELNQEFLVESIKIYGNNNVLRIKRNDLPTYFNFNKNIFFNNSNFSLVTQKTKNNHYDPFMVSKPRLSEIIQNYLY